MQERKVLQTKSEYVKEHKEIVLQNAFNIAWKFEVCNEQW